ncbi:hypothetical protein GOODEAATRI_007351 [Goodea atripinnis]|uniref:3'-5' exonuclease domain-containing protein n=1 Tax=Goodea atripinnis TaxID=208336 RepID=A0ABV0P468_9TELE
MATYSGLCVLVRLLTFRSGQQPFPLSFMEVLRDPHILKVGVGSYDDGKRLTRDYGLSLTSTVDLRYFAFRHSLKSLAADLLNVSLDKSLELRCSDWEADQLTLEQMMYAARDAQISIALFLHLLGLQTETSPAFSSGSSYLELVSRCQGLVDVPFRGRGDGDAGAHEGERKRRTQKPAACETPESGDQQVPDPRRNNKRKPLGVGYSARKTSVLSVAKRIPTSGLNALVLLLWITASRSQVALPFLYVKFTVNSPWHGRKNIVPHEYRRHFPTEMKDHNSHDILLLCTSCHAASNVHDGFLKEQLADEFSAPQGCEEGVRLLEDSDRRRVRSAARALLSAKDGLPEQRREELQALIKNYMNMNEEQELTDEALQEAASLETR